MAEGDKKDEVTVRRTDVLLQAWDVSWQDAKNFRAPYKIQELRYQGNPNKTPPHSLGILFYDGYECSLRQLGRNTLVYINEGAGELMKAYETEAQASILFRERMRLMPQESKKAILESLTEEARGLLSTAIFPMIT